MRKRTAKIAEKNIRNMQEQPPKMPKKKEPMKKEKK